MTLRCARAAFSFLFALTLVFALNVGVGVGYDGDASDLQAALAAWSRRDALEEDFFDVLWRCDSPLSEKRERAKDELTRRSAEFEPVSCERAFLTNGEISTTARDAFLDAEERYYERVVEEQTSGFVFSSVDVSGPGADGRRRVVAKVTIPERVRVIYLVPDFSRYALALPETSTRWIPTSPYAAPEIQPGIAERTIEIEATLHEARGDDQRQETSEEVGIEALVGCDLRPIAIPIENGDLEPKTKSYRVGELSYSGAKLTAQDERRVSLDFSFTYAEPYDAFDSHRAWLDRADFALALQRDDGAPACIFPVKLQETSRNASGARVRLTFEISDIPAENEPVSNKWTLLWRAPRRLVSFRRKLAINALL